MNVKETLENLKSQNNFRTLKKVGAIEGKYITVDETKYINFSSNDYLGLNSEEYEKDFLNNKLKLGATSSRLLTGNHRSYQEFEQLLEVEYNRPALHFNSGYHANETVIKLFFNNEDVIFCDELNHASIFEGVKSSGAKIVIYKHLDMDDLKSKLERYRANYKDALIITESIYSMDGDMCDLKELVELKKEYNTKLYLDECHSYGVIGNDGLGLAKHLNLVADVDYVMIGFGKAGYSIGAIVLCSQMNKDYIINKGRNFIYTTALPELNVEWNKFIFNRIKESQEKREHLDHLKEYTLDLLEEKGIKTSSTTHIISIVIGEHVDAVTTKLQSEGYLLYPIKYPTVKKGQERIRISLNANLTTTDIDGMVGLIW